MASGRRCLGTRGTTGRDLAIHAHQPDCGSLARGTATLLFVSPSRLGSKFGGKSRHGAASIAHIGQCHGEYRASGISLAMEHYDRRVSGCAGSLAGSRQYDVLDGQLVWILDPSRSHEVSERRVVDLQGVCASIWLSHSVSLISTRYMRAHFFCVEAEQVITRQGMQDSVGFLS